jgi:hypothetical protein
MNETRTLFVDYHLLLTSFQFLFPVDHDQNVHELSRTSSIYTRDINVNVSICICEVICQ